MPNGHGLGRRPSPDTAHLERFRLRAVMSETVATVERFLSLPNPIEYRQLYDQGKEGACVGFSCSWMMSILNRKRYAARRLYLEAQAVDEYDDTPPSEGTSVRAGMDVLRTQGHWRLYAGGVRIGRIAEGIAANRWAVTVDEVRTAISQGIPVVFGIDWYDAFDSPHYLNDGWWIGKQLMWGPIRGGHAICAYGASDERQAIRLINTWGFDYPPVWLPYTAVQILLDSGGECAVVTDR